MLAELTKRVVTALKPQEKPYEVRDTGLRDFLLRVEPGGTKSFYYVYRLAGGRAGKRKRYRIGMFPGVSVDGARAIARRVAGEVAAGVDVQARKAAGRQQALKDRLSTLRAFLEGRYEPWARTHLKSADFQLARLRSDFEAWLDKPMHELNGFAVEGMRQRWRKTGIQPRSINRDVQRLQSVLSRAVEWGVVARHPLAGLKPMKADKTGRVRFLSVEEEKALRTALDNREEHLRKAHERFNAWRKRRHLEPWPFDRSRTALDHLPPLVLVALNTGLRRGELLGLTWGSVNFAGKMMTVVAATAKSGQTRRVPLNTEALKVLTEWYEKQGEPKNDALVFPGLDGERMKRVDTSWKSLVQAAKLKDFRLHDCRHHFASKLVQAGVDLYTVKELLGHSEIAMTERYSHLAPDTLRAAVEKVCR